MKICFQLIVLTALIALTSPPLWAQPSLKTTAIVATPLGSSTLILSRFEGTEALSELFHFRLEVIAPNRIDIPFEAILGQEVSIVLQIPGEAPRAFSGICSRISQGDRGPLFTTYKMELVPQFWLLTLTSGSRIFQQLSVPEILRAVFGEANLAIEMNLTDLYHPRNYVTQYRESDFDFVSRLMEEEGIYYYFRHSAGGHALVLSDTPAGHAGIPSESVSYDPGRRAGVPAVLRWEKGQTLRSGKYTLRDYHFQLPGESLEATAEIQERVQVGTVEHLLRLPATAEREIYDYPGEYAQRFDAIDPSGGEQPAELEKIFEDNARTVGIRMAEEAVSSLSIEGQADSARLIAGHRFSLNSHFNADGSYVITRVTHSARRSSQTTGLEYKNSFQCIPSGLPFRPARVTPKPVIPGTQTAFVVGPPGETVFTDRYGRVKVQFHWDREGQNDQFSSAWVRVGALNAGRESGVPDNPEEPYRPFMIPEVGDEVVIAFIEGDPSRPIIVGSVWNANDRPPPTMDDQ